MNFQEQLEKYQDILGHIQASSEYNYDLVLNSKRISLGNTINPDKVQYQFITDDAVKLLEFQHYALGQLLTRIGVPGTFYHKNPDMLKTLIFNYWIKQQDKDFLFRFNDQHKVRAVLTDRYGILDDKDLFPIVIPELMKESTEPRHLIRDDQVTQFAVNFTDAVTEIDGNKYQAGLTITNSETGYSSVWIEPVVYVNGYTYCNRIILQQQNVPMRIVHRGAVDPTRILPMVQQAKEIAQVGIVQLVEASKTRMSSTAAISMLDSIDVLTKRFKDMLVEEWQEQESITQLEASRQILECVKDLPLFQRLNVTQQVGKFNGVFKGYKSRLQGLIDDLDDE